MTRLSGMMRKENSGPKARLEGKDGDRFSEDTTTVVGNHTAICVGPKSGPMIFLAFLLSFASKQNVLMYH